MIVGISLIGLPLFKRFSLSYLSHERAPHNKLSVLPVPVGDSRRAFYLSKQAFITFYI